MTEKSGMPFESTEQSMPPAPPQQPDNSQRQRGRRLVVWALMVTVLALVLAASVNLRDFIEERFFQAVSDLVGQPVRARRIALTMPLGVVLEEVEAGPFGASEIRLSLSLPELLRSDLPKAIQGFSLDDGVYSVEGFSQPLTFHLEGDVVADDRDLVVRLTEGGLSAAGEEWALDGEFRLHGRELVDGKMTFAIPGVDEGFVIATGPSGASGLTLRITGKDLPLTKLWPFIARWVAQAIRQPFPPPKGGRVDLDLTARIDRLGIQMAAGEAVARTVEWEPLALEQVRVELNHQRSDAPPSDDALSSAEVMSGSGVAANLEIDGAWFGDSRIAWGALSIAGVPQGVRLSGELAVGGGRVVASDLVLSRERLSGQLLLDEVALPALEGIIEGAGYRLTPDRWRGRTSGTLRVDGSFEAPMVRWELTGDRAGFRSAVWDRVEARGTWRGTEWEVESAQAKGPGDFSLAVAGHGRSGTGYELDVEWRDVSARGVGELLEHALLRRLDLFSSGIVHLRQNGSGVEIAGEASVQRVDEEWPLEASLTVDGSFVDGIAIDGRFASGEGIASASFIFGERGSQLSGELAAFPLQAATGALGLEGIEGDLSGEFHVHQPREGAPAGVLNVQAERLSVAGVVIREAMADLDLAGPPSLGRGGDGMECASCLYGEGIVRGRIAGAKAAGRGELIELHAEANGDEIVLTPASFGLWGGRVTVEGGARLEDATWQVGLTSEGRALDYSGEGLSARLGYSATLNGPVDALSLEANAHAKDGQIDLFQLQSFAGRAAAPGALSLGGYDLAIDLESFRVSARSLLDAEVAGSLRLTGSGAVLHSSGDVQVVRGYFGYLGRRFDILRGRASFPGIGLIPHLDVTGSVPVDGVTLYVDATGPADNLSLAVRTEPPVDAERLRAMMVEPLGHDPEGIDGDWKRLAGLLSSAVNRQVVSELYWTIGRALEEALDIDLVSLAPQGESGLQLTLGKYVRSDLYLTYRRDVIHGLQEGVSLEYTLGPGRTLRSSWDRERGASFDLGISVPF